jgi:hypothetical protein
MRNTIARSHDCITQGNRRAAHCSVESPIGVATLLSHGVAMARAAATLQIIFRLNEVCCDKAYLRR